MAVPVGRSVVFVTGNAKKLEEVTIAHLVPLADYVYGHAITGKALHTADLLPFSCYLSRLCVLNIDSEHVV